MRPSELYGTEASLYPLDHDCRGRDHNNRLRRVRRQGIRPLAYLPFRNHPRVSLSLLLEGWSRRTPRTCVHSQAALHSSTGAK